MGPPEKLEIYSQETAIHSQSLASCFLATKKALYQTAKQTSLLSIVCRVEAPITAHLRDYAPHLEKYKVVQIFPV